jgi:hypothetical protein
MIRTVGEPLGNSNLRIYLTGSHGDARLLTGGNDFLRTQLAVAENSDKSNKHGDPSLMKNTRSGQPMQGSCHY